MVDYRPSSFFLSAIADSLAGTESSHMAHRMLFCHSIVSHFHGRLSTSILEVSVKRISLAAGPAPVWSSTLHTTHIATKHRRETVYILYVFMCMSREVMAQ